MVAAGDAGAAQACAGRKVSGQSTRQSGASTGCAGAVAKAQVQSSGEGASTARGWTQGLYSRISLSGRGLFSHGDVMCACGIGANTMQEVDYNHRRRTGAAFAQFHPNSQGASSRDGTSGASPAQVSLSHSNVWGAAGERPSPLRTSTPADGCSTGHGQEQDRGRGVMLSEAPIAPFQQSFFLHSSLQTRRLGPWLLPRLTTGGTKAGLKRTRRGHKPHHSNKGCYISALGQHVVCVSTAACWCQLGATARCV